MRRWRHDAFMHVATHPDTQHAVWTKQTNSSVTYDMVRHEFWVHDEGRFEKPGGWRRSTFSAALSLTLCVDECLPMCGHQDRCHVCPQAN